ncbi:MAG: BamA/TamA family outer membrane protein [Myxococcota bacterium]
MALVLFLASWVMGTSPVANAATYDPDLTWRTIRTEHFHIHFHQGIEQVADEFAGMVEEVYDEMRDELQWELQGRVELTLIDRTDAANGFASSVPYNAITIYVTAPTEDSTLNLYEDWSRAIFTHELTHVIHLEANHGIVRATRAVIGRIASTNDLSPSWMIEGLATMEETRKTPGGRGRASWPDMIKRAAVVEDAFPPLGNLDGYQPMPPAGNLRYLFGQDFMQHVADHRGRDAWTQWVHTYGSSIPFILPGKKVFGKRLRRLYREWRKDLSDRYLTQAAEVRAEGETVGRLISAPEASCSAPAFSPDGRKLVWSCFDQRTGSALWMSDGMGYAPEKLLQDFGAGYFTWRADSEAFVYASTHIVNQFNVYSDIYMHTLGKGNTALTSGARARDPDFSPDGSRLLYVTNRAQDNQLEVLTVDRRRSTLTNNRDHTQYSTPRHSPDGRVVALSMWQDGRRDLWLMTPEGEPLRRITADDAIDADPVWSADGQWLYFSSDRSGIPNVYAIKLATEELFQVTNVVTGAIKPTVHPSGERMAYMQYSQDGWDVRILDLDPKQFRPRGKLPRSVRYGQSLSEFVGTMVATAIPAASWDEVGTPVGIGKMATTDPFTLPGARPQDPDSLDNFANTEVENVFGEEKDYPFQIPPRRYNPLPTLRPRFVLPSIRTTPFGPRSGGPFAFTCIDDQLFCPGLQVSLATSSSDALRRYGLAASASYRTDANAFGGGLSFTVNRFLPVYTVGVSTRVGAAAQLSFVDDTQVDEEGNPLLFTTDPPSIYWERRSSAFVTVSWPYRLRTRIFAQYAFTDRRPRFDLPANVFRPNVPLIGFVGALSGGWRYSWSQPTPLAISPEDARSFSFVGSFLAPWLGTFARDLETGDLTGITQVQVASELRQYVVTPWRPNHVIAGRVAAGITLGDSDFFGNYQLGGNIGDGGFQVSPDSLRMIRGYPLAFDIGDLYWLGSLEYRFPLWYVYRGVGTLPVFARNLSAAVFIDTGNAFNNPSLGTGGPARLQEWGEAAIANPLVGVGAEIQWRLVVAWGIGLTGRVGYAVGLTEGGIRPNEGTRPFYIQLGGSF